jgi:hypothetical protein
MRDGDGERAKPADDCLGRARTLDHPAAARVAELRRMGKNEKRGHC